MVNKFGKMDPSMMANGREIKQTAKELSSMLMEIFTKGNGLMIKLMAMEHINMLTAQLMLVSGLRTSNTELVLKNGQMEQSMKDNIRTERNMETVV